MDYLRAELNSEARRVIQTVRNQKRLVFLVFCNNFIVVDNVSNLRYRFGHSLYRSLCTEIVMVYMAAAGAVE